MRRFKLIPVILFYLCVIMQFGLTNHVMAKEKDEDVNVRISADIPYRIIKKGTTVNIKASGTANDKKITKFTYTSENKKVATVDKNGKIKVIAPGEGRIKIDSKDYPGNETWVNFTASERIIKISGVKNCKAGDTYQLKASEKDVIWECDNSLGINANASINSETGELRVRNAGRIYVKCSSRDGKGFGAVYIYAAGPMIEDQNITLDLVAIEGDEHLVSITELAASGRIPNKVTVPYTEGKKTGTVDLSIEWDPFFNNEKYEETGIYTIKGFLKAPEGYFLNEQSGNVKIDVNFKTIQTDTRKKITAIEKVDNITVTEDKHITNEWNLVKDIKLQCKLEDGSTVEIPLGYISYENEVDLSKAGTYEVELYPKTVAGYSTGNEEDIHTNIKIEVLKEQTQEPATLDDIAPESWVDEYTSQDEIR